MKTKAAKKTIATHTYLNSDNYGSVLQAYALNYTLRKMGYDAFVIDYKKNDVAKMYQIFSPNISLYNILTNCYHLLYYGQLIKKQNHYKEFRQLIKKTSIQYHNHQQLLNDPPKAECYICGSDQIWNTQIIDFDDSYLLDFVRFGKKISYAASGITNQVPEENICRISEHISDFDAISVREEIGKERLNYHLNNHVVKVVDPVLLLNTKEWQEVFNSINICPTKKPYMFCYFAGGVSKDFEKYTMRLAKEYNLERILIMPEWRNMFRKGRKYYQSGPAEFLALLNSASIVCTNSFHGTALSILFNKCFLVGLHVPFSEDRITTLLNLCELTDREIDPEKYVYSQSIMDIDFTTANSVLREERERSIEWLKKAIEQ